MGLNNLHPLASYRRGIVRLSCLGRNGYKGGSAVTAQPRYGSSEAELIEMARSIPLGRMAQSDEIARAAVFLASENAGFVTGQSLHVNGGSYLA